MTKWGLLVISYGLAHLFWVIFIGVFIPLMFIERYRTIYLAALITALFAKNNLKRLWKSGHQPTVEVNGSTHVWSVTPRWRPKGPHSSWPVWATFYSPYIFSGGRGVGFLLDAFLQPKGSHSFFHRRRVLRHFPHLSCCFFDGPVIWQLVSTEQLKRFSLRLVLLFSRMCYWFWWEIIRWSI